MGYIESIHDVNYVLLNVVLLLKLRFEEGTPVTIAVKLEGSGIQSDPSRTNPDGQLRGLHLSSFGT